MIGDYKYLYVGCEVALFRPWRKTPIYGVVLAIRYDKVDLEWHGLTEDRNGNIGEFFLRINTWLMDSININDEFIIFDHAGHEL